MEAALWRASGQFALTWQIARQLDSATVGHQLVGSSGELLTFYASSTSKSSQFLIIVGRGSIGQAARDLQGLLPVAFSS